MGNMNELIRHFLIKQGYYPPESNEAQAKWGVEINKLHWLSPKGECVLFEDIDKNEYSNIQTILNKLPNNDLLIIDIDLKQKTVYFKYNIYQSTMSYTDNINEVLLNGILTLYKGAVK